MGKIESKIRQLAFLLIVILSLISCNHTSKMPTDMQKMNKTPDFSSGDGKYIISAPIVKKAFVKKNGQATDFGEYYLRRSIQDYFIKFCESKISRKELENHLKAMKNEIKSATLEVEFRQGNWDICDGDPQEMQSRVGEYVVIHRIVKSTD